MVDPPWGFLFALDLRPGFIEAVHLDDRMHFLVQARHEFSSGGLQFQMPLDHRSRNVPYPGRKLFHLAQALHERLADFLKLFFVHAAQYSRRQAGGRIERSTVSTSALLGNMNWQCSAASDSGVSRSLLGDALNRTFFPATGKIRGSASLYQWLAALSPMKKITRSGVSPTPN